MVPTNIFGDIPIRPWEWAALFFYLVLIFIFAGVIQRRKIKWYPEYRYYNLALLAKIAGGLGFAMVYLHYYGGGDTFSYYETSLAFTNMLEQDPGTFMETYFGGPSLENKSKFTPDTGVPLGYIYFNGNNLMVSKLMVPLMLLGMESYLITTVLVSVVTFYGLWKLYRMFISYYPYLQGKLAFTVLFMPSVVFWGGGIIKDSLTLAATCYYIVATEHLINKRTAPFSNLFIFLLSTYFILSIKPYVIIIFIPGTLVWFFYHRVQRLKNRLFRYLVLPFIYLGILGGSYLILTSIGGSLGKFSLDKALNMATVIHEDLQQDYYEGHSFDIGDFEATPSGVASKFPIATISGLYRPFLPEVKNSVMLFSALETTLLLFLTLYPFWRNKFMKLWTFLTSNPLLIYCLIISILFAFMVGLTTPNYGALVRFRIPFLPLFTSALMVLGDRMTVNAIGKGRGEGKPLQSI